MDAYPCSTSDNKDATFQRTIYLVAGGGATYAFLSHMKKLLFPDLYYLAFSASDFRNWA